MTRLFVSGRLCLFGEHSDWAAEHGRHSGYCLVVGTDQGLWATACRSEQFEVDTPVPSVSGQASQRRRQMLCACNEATLREAAEDSDEFFRYCAGVALHVMRRHRVGGLRLHISAMDLPLRKGVSSSAAICILVARAFNAVYGLNLFPHELMELAYQGEKHTGSQCGRMDQACIYGKTPVLLTFAPGQKVQVELMSPRRSIHMFFVDLAGRKDTVRILHDLQGAYGQQEELQRALGEINEANVRRAFAAVQDGDSQALGALMTKAQQDFDRLVAPVCPGELASPVLHELLANDFLRPHVWGGKGVGSQGDGVAQFVARSPADQQEAMAKIAHRMPQMRSFPLTISAALSFARPSHGRAARGNGKEDAAKAAARPAGNMPAEV